MAGGGSLSQFKDVGDAVTLKYSDVGKKIGNISKLNSRVAELEKSFMSSGKAFNKFSGYIKLEAMYPTESKDLNNSSYAEWNAIVSRTLITLPTRWITVTRTSISVARLKLSTCRTGIAPI